MTGQDVCFTINVKSFVVSSGLQTDGTWKWRKVCFSSVSVFMKCFMSKKRKPAKP